MWRAKVLPTLVAAALITVGLVGRHGSAAATPLDSTVVVHAYRGEEHPRTRPGRPHLRACRGGQGHAGDRH